MSEQSKRVIAGAKVIEDVMAAHERGEVSDPLVLGFRLMATALSMTTSHQRGAVKIARDYATAVGIDADILEEQVALRMQEVIAFNDLTGDIEGREGR